MAQYLFSVGKQKTVLWQKKRGEPCEARESVAICTPRLTGKFYYGF